MNIKQFVRKDILEMESYKTVPSVWDLGIMWKQKAQKVNKLNAGENMWLTFENLRKVLASYSFYNYYPDPEYKELRKAIALYTQVDASQIMVGSGSDELIDLLLRLLLEVNDEVINCPPTFGMYDIAITLNRGIQIQVPRKADFSLDISGILKRVTSKTKVIIVCNPNNPTGTLTPLSEIETLLKTGKIVMVDEAYFEFSKLSAQELLPQYENLVILRTFSKWAGLAGLRVGYAFASPTLIAEFMKMKPPYNVNLAAEVAAIDAIKRIEQISRTTKKIIQERQRIMQQLSKINTLEVFNSCANFIFVKTKLNDMKPLKKYLETNKIAVRYYSSQLMGNAIRITVGTPTQNKTLITKLKEYYEKN